MVVQMDVHDLGARFPDLLARVRNGEEVTIADAGEPVARLVPVKPEPGRRVLGAFQGRVYMADDFTAPLPEDVLEEFEK